MSNLNLISIGTLFDLEKGSLQSSKCTEGEYIFITASQEWKTHNNYSHECEALIFAAAASGSLGRTHYIDDKFIASDLCFILTPKNNKKYPINLKFYQFVFNSLKDEIVKNTKTGTSKEAINQSNFRNYEIPYFEIEKQNLWIDKLINAKLMSADMNIEIKNQQSFLKQLKQTILQEAIEGKLTANWREQNQNIGTAKELLEEIKKEKIKLIKEKKIKAQKPLPAINDNEIPFDIPTSWEWCKLGEILNIVRGGSPRPAGDKKYYDGTIPFLKVADLTKDDGMYVDGYSYTIKEAGLYKTRYLQEETLMLTNSGATLGVPKICNFPTAFNDGIAAFIRMNISLFKPFFYYLLKSKTTWFLKEASRGQGQPNLNTDIIGETIIPFPPLEEQKEIVATIEKLFAICDELESEVKQNKSTVDKLMTTVLKEAFE